jgi:hypothetical protein
LGQDRTSQAQQQAHRTDQRQKAWGVRRNT